MLTADLRVGTLNIALTHGGIDLGILSECVLRFYKYSVYPDQCTNCG